MKIDRIRIGKIKHETNTNKKKVKTQKNYKNGMETNETRKGSIVK